MHIAIIGTGISGNAAALALSGRHRVTVYEREARPGGHSHTVDIAHEGRTIPVDTGFIVYNTRNYPMLTALFDHLGVETTETEMSFAVSVDRGRREWGGANLASVFAQKRNIVSPNFLGMLLDIARFNRTAGRHLAEGHLCGLSLGQYLERRKFSQAFREDYLLPMGAAIWSSPAREILDFPAESFIGFFDNHRLLSEERPVWRTVVGGSRRYVAAMQAAMRADVRLGCAATRVERLPEGVAITDTSGARLLYDGVVMACHSDEALALLADADADEHAVLSAARYRPNHVYLHRDPALMPRRRAVWSAWNYLRWRREDGADVPDVAVTYWMNALQHIDPAVPVFVSLNPPAVPDPVLTYQRFVYEHPQFDQAAIAAQARLPSIQGRRGTWFAGAWTGHGFHEDGIRSGLEVGEAMGGGAPWRVVPEAAPMLVAAE